MATQVSEAGRAAARRGLILVVLAAVLWGTSGVATKAIYAITNMDPISVAAFRLVLGAPLLLISFRCTAGFRSFRVARSDLALMVLVGAAIGISQALYFAAIARVGVAIATLVTVCIAPVLVCLCSRALLRERLTPALAGALACALIGTALMVGAGQNELGGGQAVAVGGILLALASAVSFAAFILLSRLIANRYHPLHSIAIAISIGAVLLVGISAANTGIHVGYSLPVWALLLYLGVVPTALAYALFFHGMEYATAGEASIASLAEPLAATGLALVLFGERLGTLGFLGGALLIAVMAFLYQNGSS